MKVTKRQLRRIVKEEKAKLNEGFKEVEADLVEDILELLINAQAISDDDNAWQNAANYLRDAVIPQLEDEQFATLQNPNARY